MIYKLIYAVFAYTLLLSGCATQAPKIPSTLTTSDWQQHQTQILAINDWQITGKLGVKVPNDGGSANLHWQQQNAQYQIDLNGPMGLGKMIISGAPGNVSFLQGANPPQKATTAEELIAKHTGWKIPVTQLAFWVRGLPASETKVTRHTLNAQGLLSELDQMGWKVIYSEYLTTMDNKGESVTLPSHITAEYQDVKLTLIIRNWQLNHLDVPPV